MQQWLHQLIKLTWCFAELKIHFIMPGDYYKQPICWCSHLKVHKDPSCKVTATVASMSVDELFACGNYCVNAIFRFYPPCWRVFHIVLHLLARDQQSIILMCSVLWLRYRKWRFKLTANSVAPLKINGLSKLMHVSPEGLSLMHFLTWFSHVVIGQIFQVVYFAAVVP